MTQLNAADEQRLLSAIFPIIIEKGIKATTMDLLAHRLGMSKRTLYEIFDNKTDLIRRVLDHHEEHHHELGKRIIASAPNMMVALMQLFDLHRQDMVYMNVSFFRDMDRLYPHLRCDYEERHEQHRRYMMQIFRIGVEQGVFRGDINFSILLRMMEIQAESLKRMENLFPPDITLLEIYDTLTLGFLRSIASRQGHDLLDDYMRRRNELSLNQSPT
jgi:AcrR family transcriptional regulator